MLEDVLERIVREEENRVMDYLRSRASNIRRDVEQAIKDAFYSSSIYDSLLDGSLRAEMGLEDPNDTLESVIGAIAKATALQMNVDGMLVGAFDQNFQDALSDSEAKYTSTNSAGRNKLVPWLNWLLTSGGRAVVKDYKYVEGSFGHGRTGRGLMIYDEGAMYSVTGAGTPRSNWITHVADIAAPKIEEILLEVIDGI